MIDLNKELYEKIYEIVFIDYLSKINSFKERKKRRSKLKIGDNIVFKYTYLLLPSLPNKLDNPFIELIYFDVDIIINNINVGLLVFYVKYNYKKQGHSMSYYIKYFYKEGEPLSNHIILNILKNTKYDTKDDLSDIDYKIPQWASEEIIKYSNWLMIELKSKFIKESEQRKIDNFPNNEELEYQKQVCYLLSNYLDSKVSDYIKVTSNDYAYLKFLLSEYILPLINYKIEEDELDNIIKKVLKELI